jgi:hypothetical protein
MYVHSRAARLAAPNGTDQDGAQPQFNGHANEPGAGTQKDIALNVAMRYYHFRFFMEPMPLTEAWPPGDPSLLRPGGCRLSPSRGGKVRRAKVDRSGTLSVGPLQFTHVDFVHFEHRLQNGL